MAPTNSCTSRPPRKSRRPSPRSWPITRCSAMSFLDFHDDDPKRAERRPLLFFHSGDVWRWAPAPALFTEPNISTWYAALAQPVFRAARLAVRRRSGPRSICLMAVAAWRAWRVTGLKSTAMALYGLQLAFNFVWTAMFFGPHQIGAGAGRDSSCWCCCRLITNFLFWRTRPLGGPAVPAVSALDRVRKRSWSIRFMALESLKTRRFTAFKAWQGPPPSLYTPCRQHGLSPACLVLSIIQWDGPEDAVRVRTPCPSERN